MPQKWWGSRGKVREDDAVVQMGTRLGISPYGGKAVASTYVAHGGKEHLENYLYSRRKRLRYKKKTTTKKKKKIHMHAAKKKKEKIRMHAASVNASSMDDGSHTRTMIHIFTASLLEFFFPSSSSSS